MRTYIKIYGPPVVKAIRALEKLAVDMPEVCIMDTFMVQGLPASLARDVGATPRRSAAAPPTGQFGNWAMGYFRSSQIPISIERCSSIISDSGQRLGDHDFYFEWREEPKMERINILIERIDEAFKPLGCHYTITTR